MLQQSRMQLPPLARHLACAAFIIFSLTACMDGRPYGWIKNEHGELVRNTPENIQRAEAAAIERELKELYPKHGPFRVVFSEPPEYFQTYDDEDFVGDTGWRYPTMIVSVLYAGTQATAADETAIQEVVKDAMKYRMQEVSNPTYEVNFRPDAVVAATATVSVPAATTASYAKPATADPASEKAAAEQVEVREGTIRYTIQAGDTLAGIAKAHYGDASHWQRIVQANPGLDAFKLKVGAVINIPAPGSP